MLAKGFSVWRSAATVFFALSACNLVAGALVLFGELEDRRLVSFVVSSGALFLLGIFMIIFVDAAGRTMQRLNAVFVVLLLVLPGDILSVGLAVYKRGVTFEPHLVLELLEIVMLAVSTVLVYRARRRVQASSIADPRSIEPDR